jgi:hypothetical protein
MNVLIACEYSGRVREAFRRLGHDAWSCDLLPSEDDSEYHYIVDAKRCIGWGSWDLIIAHPPCTHLSASGAKHWKAKQADGRQQEGIDFFLWFTRLTIPWAIENPIGIMSTVYRKPDQIIQPWQFGHGETKATCLWLHELTPLVPTNVVEGREAKVHRMSPSPTRWKDRSRTYQGIADAMALQWSEDARHYQPKMPSDRKHLGA